MHRRDILRSGALALGTPILSHAEAATPLKVTDPANALAVYARLRGAGEGLALWWYTGNVWGKTPDDVARVLFTVQGLTFQRVIATPDGGLEQRMTGRGFYGDPETGRPLERWTNPLTGASHAAPHIRSLQKQFVAPDGRMLAEADRPVEIFDGRIGGLTVSGDTLWMTENFVAKGTPGNGRPAATTSSLSTFTARVAEVEASAGFVPCQLNYQSLGAWPAWMEMGARPGVLSWQTYGHKIRSADAAPRGLRDWIENRFPGFLANPGI